jgi:cell division protein FtsQ
MDETQEMPKIKWYVAVWEFFRQHKSLFIIFLMAAAAVYGLYSGYNYLIDNYAVTKIYVDGNTQHSNQEIIDIVTQGRFGKNSLYLSWKYKDKSIDDIPFIEKIDVQIVDKDTVRISVYEKAVAGYVVYLGSYLYFDKDGVIVESSDVRQPGIPEVIGLTFDYAVKHEKLPVGDTTIFTAVLGVRQLLEQYGVAADRISYTDREEITLHFGNIRVALGNEGYIDEKIMELPNILPTLAGRSGVLRMETYDEYALETIFEAD